MEVLDDVVVLGFEAYEDAVVIDLVGSPESICAWVRFEVPDPEAGRHWRALLERWRDDGTRLTYVLKGDQGRLMDLEAMATTAD